MFSCSVVTGCTESEKKKKARVALSILLMAVWRGGRAAVKPPE